MTHLSSGSGGRRATCVAAAAALLAATATGLAAQGTSGRGGDGSHGPGAQCGRERYLQGADLVIHDQGSFFIGGVPKTTFYNNTDTASTNPADIIIGQMYVQFQIPGGEAARQYKGWPVIHVHGSSHTGAALEATPDCREGWLPLFVRRGIPTYVVDQAGRGRSGFDQSVIHEAVANGELDSIPTFGRISSSQAWTAWFGHILPVDSAGINSNIITGTMIRHGDPGDPHGGDSVHTNDYLPAFPIGTIDSGIAAREGAIGPAVNPANNNYLALTYYKQLVPNGEVTLPRSICEACEPDTVQPQNTWTPRALADLVEQLGGAIVATHSQSGNMGHHMTRILKERGSLQHLKALITIEGGCSLTGAGLTGSDFDNIAYLTVQGDYRRDDQELGCLQTVDSINASPGRTATRARHLELDELGRPEFLGTTHMMMLGTNHRQVASRILTWAAANIPDRP